MKTELTSLGKMLRKMRIESGERLADLAGAVGCATSFLSAVELGTKSPPESLLDRIVEHYGLDTGQQRELRARASRSTKEVRVNLEEVSDLSRELAVAFARTFPSIDQNKAQELLGILDPGRTSRERIGSRSTAAKSK